MELNKKTVIGVAVSILIIVIFGFAAKQLKAPEEEQDKKKNTEYHPIHLVTLSENTDELTEEEIKKHTIKIPNSIYKEEDMFYLKLEIFKDGEEYTLGNLENTFSGKVESKRIEIGEELTPLFKAPITYIYLHKKGESTRIDIKEFRDGGNFEYVLENNLVGGLREGQSITTYLEQIEIEDEEILEEISKIYDEANMKHEQILSEDISKEEKDKAIKELHQKIENKINEINKKSEIQEGLEQTSNLEIQKTYKQELPEEFKPDGYKIDSEGNVEIFERELESVKIVGKNLNKYENTLVITIGEEIVEKKWELIDLYKKKKAEGESREEKIEEIPEEIPEETKEEPIPKTKEE